MHHSIRPSLLDIYFAGAFVQFELHIHRKIVEIRAQHHSTSGVVEMLFDFIQVNGQFADFLFFEQRLVYLKARKP